jgi:hypothetical protein
MKLYVELMDATVVEVGSDGRVRLENEDWSVPTLQETRAIIYAAKKEIDDLNDAVDVLQNSGRHV